MLLCLAAALLSASLARVMIRLRVLDQPGDRSSHTRATPKGGGVGVMVATLALVPVALWLRGAGPVSPAACLLAGTLLLAWVSWLDDLRQFRPLFKLLAQIAAAAIVLAGIEPYAGNQALGVAIGFGWLIFVSNAVNFIDGLNGLAGGSLALAALAIGLTGPSGLEQAAGCLLAASLAGFLPFNWPNARIFLGDVGSQGGGLLIAALGLLRWHDAGAPGLLTMPLLLSGILFDVGVTLCRRALAGERLSQAHRGHLYQIAHRSGVAAPLIAALHWGFVAWGGLLGLAVERDAIRPLTAILAAALVQLSWASFVLARVRRQPIGRW